MTDPARLDITEARALMRDKRLTPRDLVRACLARIAERDGEVRAWLHVNPQAEAEAAQIAPGDPRPLAGIPVGVKDVIDTGDMPTTHNSPLYGGRQPCDDAPCVAMLRAAGAVILGKTDTTEFAAAGRNAATANPHDLSRTPGGSSAGSAAAVADCHVPLALGTQTGGSTIRPASFCGVPAIKPSWGLISAEGVKLYSQSMDTVGIFARSHRDLSLLAGIYGLPEGGSVPAVPRIAICRPPYMDLAAPEVDALMDSLAQRLEGLAEVVLRDLPGGLDDLDALHRCVQMSEGAAAFRNLDMGGNALVHADFISRARRDEGHGVEAMFAAYDRLADHRRTFEAHYADVDGVLAPAAPGFAPKGHGPGNPVLNALWTAMQLPCIALPVLNDPMPLGVQLLGPRGQDRRLLRLAETLAPALTRAPAPADTPEKEQIP